MTSQGVKERKWLYVATFYGKREGAIGESHLMKVRVFTHGAEPDWAAARAAVYAVGYEHLEAVKISLCGEVSE